MVVLSCLSVKISGDFNYFLKSFIIFVDFYTFNSPNFFNLSFQSFTFSLYSRVSTHFQTHILVFVQNALSSSIWIHQISIHLLISVQGFTLTLLNFFLNIQTLAFSFLFRKVRHQIGVLKARSRSSIWIHQTDIHLRPRSSASARHLRHRSSASGRRQCLLAVARLSVIVS